MRAKRVSRYGKIVCAACQKRKPVEEFYSDRRNKSGLDSYCKVCRKAVYHRRKLRKLQRFTTNVTENRL